MKQLIRHRQGFVLGFIVMISFVFMAFSSHQGRAPISGKALFEENCAKCHGADGTRGRFGAANLRKSVMPDEAIIQRIENGKSFMPSFKKRLTPDEIREIAGYVKTLRSN